MNPVSGAETAAAAARGEPFALQRLAARPSIADLVAAARRELASGTAWRARQVRARRMDKARADRETAELQAILGRLLIARDAGLEILAADTEGLAVLHPDGQVRRYALVPVATETAALTKESPEAFAQRWKRTEVAREAAVSALMKEPSDA